ncbi:MAG: hypothetical protein HDS21_00230 [Bacteroides sp.]|nr:hypothetical protein [Bacteroides sp.]
MEEKGLGREDNHLTGKTTNSNYFNECEGNPICADYAEIIKKSQPQMVDILNTVYRAGAMAALASQWQEPETITEREGGEVLTIYKVWYRNKWITQTSVEQPEDWAPGGFHKRRTKDVLIAWMPIPGCPYTTSKI